MMPAALALAGASDFPSSRNGRGTHRAKLAHEACRAACAREDADHDLWQANLGLRIVGGEDPVAGQRDFKANAERGAGQTQAIGLPPLFVLGSMPARSILRRVAWIFMMPAKIEAAGSSPPSSFICWQARSGPSRRQSCLCRRSG